MNNVLKKFEERQLEKLGKNLPEFSPGDTIKVNVRIKEGSRERVQAFEGVCIARSDSGLDASFTVRKISLGEGVERVFPLFSPRIESIELIRRGSVRRAKLYYLRNRRGKSARISERTTGHGLDSGEANTNEEITKTQKTAEKRAAKKAKREENRAKREAELAEKAKAKEAEAAAAAEGENAENQE